MVGFTKQKSWLPIEKLKHAATNLDLGSRGSGVPCLVLIFWKEWLNKHRRIILLHFGLVPFLGLIIGKPPNPSFSWFRDFRTCPWASPSQWFYLWRHQDTPSNPGKSQLFFYERVIWGRRNFGNQYVWKLWKRRASTNHEDPFFISLKILNMGSIFSRKPDM